MFDDGMIEVGIARTGGAVAEEMREPGWSDDGMIVESPGTKLCKAGRFEGASPLVKRLWTAAMFDDGIIDVGIAKTEGVVTEEILIELRAGIRLCRAGTFD